MAHLALKSDIAILKHLKKDFVDRLIFSAVQYQLCGEVSALLNEFIAKLEVGAYDHQQPE